MVLLDCPNIRAIFRASYLLEDYRELVGTMTHHGADLPALHSKGLDAIEELRYLSWNYFEDHPAITEQLDRLQTQMARFRAAIESFHKPQGVCAYCGKPPSPDYRHCWDCLWDYFVPAIEALGDTRGGFWTSCI